MTQSPPDPSFPRRAGGFELVRELGRGGMGVVYEARESSSGRTVALKVLAADLSLSPEAFERFQREARIAAAISDSRCVFVYGAHQVEGSPAIAMELVGGSTLQDKIARGATVPIETAVRWTLDLLEGLEAAHRSGVLHRDVKPSNCFVTPDGRVKIGDFGLSRSLERDIQLTQSGQFLGSPLYASPEQIRGRDVDERSDLYSAGATLYALLTGRSPFAGSNVGEVLARILSESPERPRSIRAEIPEDLERVVLKSLERDPAKRYRSLEAFRDALAPFSGAQTHAAPLVRRLGAYVVDFVVLMFILIPVTTTRISAGGIGAPAPYPDRPWLPMTHAQQLLVNSLPLLYFGLFEFLFGATPGKLLFGLRVVRTSSGRAGWRALLRAFVYEGPSLFGGVAVSILAASQLQLAIGTYVIMLGWTVVRATSMRPSNGWRMLHEFASGTRTIRLELPFRRVRRRAPPASAAIRADASVPATIGAYAVEGVLFETPSGRTYVARDAALERSVWIRVCPDGATADDARRTLQRPARLRWLERTRVEGVDADVFEAPGGTSLAALVDGGQRFEWSAAQRALTQLCDELAESKDLRYSASQLWIDRDWNVRVLDEPHDPAAKRDLGALELLGAAAQRILATKDALPADLPLHAEPFAARVLGQDDPFHSLDEARQALSASQARPPVVDRRIRVPQLAVGVGLPIVLAAVGCLVITLFGRWAPQLVECAALIRELHDGRVAVDDADESRGIHFGVDAEQTGVSASTSGETPSTAPALTDEDVAMRQLLLSWTLKNAVPTVVGAGLSNNAKAQEIVAAAQAAFPDPDEQAALAARARIDEQRHLQPKRRSRIEIFQHPLGIVGFVAATTWTSGALLCAIVFGNGLTPTLFGIALRRRRGRRMSRTFGFARALLSGAPFVIGYGAAAALAVHKHDVASDVTAIVVTIALLACVALAVIEPRRALVDRVLGTRLVPK